MTTITHSEGAGATRVPSHDLPEEGVISLHGVRISDVIYWQEDNLHVFRSTEFDVIAANEDKAEAVTVFIDSAEDLAEMVTDLTSDQVTQDEAEVAIRILRRLTAAYKSEADFLSAALQRRRRMIRMLRGRGHDAPRSWYRKSSLPTSSRRLLV